MPVLALPALAAIVIALAALLIYVGGPYLARFISQLVPDWHIPSFGSLRDFVSGAIGDAINVLQDWLDAALKPAAQIISYPFVAVDNLFRAAVGALDDLRKLSSWIVKTMVPAAVANALAHARAYTDALQHRMGALIERIVAALTADIAAARAYASAIVSDLQHRMGRVITDVANALRADIAAVRDYATGLVAQLQRYVDTQLAKLLATLTASIAAVDAFAHAAYNDTIGRITTAVRQLEADITVAAQQAVHDAVTDVETTVAAGISVVWPDVVAGVEGAIDGAAGGFDWIRDELAKLDLSKVTDLAGLAALSGISAAVLTRYLRECGMPNCRNLSGLGRDLQALLSLVEGVEMFGWIRELISNPEGAAHDLADEMSGLVNGTVSSARTLFGVG